MTLRVVTKLGSPAVRNLVVVAGSGALLARGQHRAAVFMAIATGGTELLNKLIKKLVGRDRPGHIFGLGQRSSSFPSGHSSGTVALAGSVCALIWYGTRNLRLTFVGAALGSAWAALVGYSRVKLHRHHVGDVFGGYVLGLLWLGICAAAARTFDRRA